VLSHRLLPYCGNFTNAMKTAAFFASKKRKALYEYIGHDEPSVLFYSHRAGSGNTNIYRVRLPKEPPLKPQQNGQGGTWNFQLRPTFWLGMAMCDDQSAPNPGGSCDSRTKHQMHSGQ
jgi:hypothetical protein